MINKDTVLSQARSSDRSDMGWATIGQPGNDVNDVTWEHFPHEADMGVRGCGATREEAFAEAARALSALATDLDAVEPKEAVPIRAEAEDDEQLLYALLDALVFEMATRHMVFRDFEIAITDGKLEATAWGEAWDEERHPAGVEVKGPTFTELHVGRTEDGRFVAQAVVDV